MNRSEIQGSEGKIVTYSFWPMGHRFYISVSETKWHLEAKYKRMPVWFTMIDGYPSLYIWNVAIFYDGKR